MASFHALFVFQIFICGVALGVPNWKTDEIRGICYSPVPHHVIPSQTVWLYDSDMFNSDFQALWGIDPSPGVVSRDDLRYIKNAGFNVIHVYDWNPILRNHIPFLDYAYELGIGVFVPFSNWFLKEGWTNHTEKVTQLVEGVTTDSGEIHPAVFGWIVGNEYDETPIDTPINNVIELLLAVAAVDPDEFNDRPFTIPSSTQAGYNGNINPGLGQLTEIRKTLLEVAPDIYYNRFINAINPFMPWNPGMIQLILDPYLKLFEKWGEDPLPFIFTETGLSQKDKDLEGKYGPAGGYLGEAGMADFEALLLTGFLNLMRDTPHKIAINASKTNFIGYSFFEFTQEDWKGGGGVDMYYGLHIVGDNISPVLPMQKSPAFKCHSLPNEVAYQTTYPVNSIKPVMAWKSIAALQTNPLFFELFSKNSTKALHEEIVIDCIVGEWEPSSECQLYDATKSCMAYQIETREIIQQANMHGNDCPANLSRLVPCTPTTGCFNEYFDITTTQAQHDAFIFSVLVITGLFIFGGVIMLKRRARVLPSKETEELGYGTI